MITVRLLIIGLVLLLLMNAVPVCAALGIPLPSWEGTTLLWLLVLQQIVFFFLMANVPGLNIGGTGTAAIGSHGAIAHVGSGGNLLAFSGVGASGDFLRSSGAGAPTWFNLFASANTWTVQQNIQAKLQVMQTGTTVGATPLLQFATGATDRAYLQADALALGDLKIQTEGNQTLHLQRDGAAGVVVGQPTGGDKGIGTINAQAVYDDNTLLTDYVFEPRYMLLPLGELQTFYEQHRHLPTIDGREQWEREGKFSLGKLTNQLWETVEVQARYIAELHARVTHLEQGRCGDPLCKP